ncbi:MAG TPA: hypothetical protein VIX19_08075 [Terriglobales bacterium]
MMHHLQRFLPSVVVLIVFATVIAQTSKQPVHLDLQVELKMDVKAKKAKAGDVVAALTMVPAILPNATVVPAGSKVLGHVTESDADSGDAHTSFISLSFESIEIKKGQVIPINSSIRAAMMPALKGTMAQQQGQTIMPLQAPNREGNAGGSAMGGGYGMGGGNGTGGTMANPTATNPPANQAEDTNKPVAVHSGEVVGMRGVELVPAGPNHASTFRSGHKNLELYEGLQMMLAVQQ